MAKRLKLEGNVRRQYEGLLKLLNASQPDLQLIANKANSLMALKPSGISFWIWIDGLYTRAQCMLIREALSPHSPRREPDEGSPDEVRFAGRGQQR